MTQEVAEQERQARLKGYIRAQLKARWSKHDTHEEWKMQTGLASTSWEVEAGQCHCQNG